ncbi:homeobox-leucine zipper protein ROC8-like [Solanum lycopersicum]|uniref:homeobox-leucine zipper protein ROC8-like n=1 Tax=Solanum lycopersicum TaxID=4081 RepID=UPI00374992ED
MVVNEVFQMAVMIEKLPPSWNDFKNYLKHKRKEMKLEDLDKNKGKGKSQANIVEKMKDANDLCAMISECNLVENPKEWFLDSGATRHICSTKEAFATYTPAEYDEDLFMGNTTTTRIAGTGKKISKKMSDSGKEPIGELSNSQKRSKRQSQYHRHSMEQIQRLEAFFNKCPHPDEDQQKQLAREAGLDHKQVKFWFQNKRTQTKTQNERSINNALRKEKERLLSENKAMKEAMKNIMCPQCDGPPIGKEERERNIENMKTENQWLTEQCEKVSNLISSVVGRPFVMDSNLAPPKLTLGSSSNSSDENLLNQNICGYPIRYPALCHENNQNNNNVQAHSININNIPAMSSSPQEHDEFHHDSRQQTIMFETIVASMNEMVELWKTNDPFWVDPSSDEKFSIHRESYGRKYSNQVLPYETSTTRIESSKDCGIVSMTAVELIHNFLDPVKWMNLFPTIVTKARTIEVLDSGTWGGSIQLVKY